MTLIEKNKSDLCKFSNTRDRILVINMIYNLLNDYLFKI